MRLDYRVLVGIGALALIVGGAFAFDVYAGGWNVVDGMGSPFKYNAFTYNNVAGRHTYTVDPDGDFDTNVKGPGVSEEIRKTKCPDIVVEQSYPYYVKITDNGYLEMDEAQIFDTYSVVSGNQTYLYDHYTIALDVTIKTAAESFHWTQTQVDYESGVADIVMRFNVALNPWVPRGTWDANWTVVGGWAGIMSMSILSWTSGLTQQPTATQPENVGHTIRSIMSEGAALNMWTVTGPAGSRSFNNTAGLVGVPSSVDGELSITLGAGAWTHAIIGGWDAILVYDVYVKYTVRVDICTALLLQPLILGGQKPLGKPASNSTGYVPEVPILSDFQKAWNEFWADIFNNPWTGVIMVLMLLIVGGTIYVVVRLFIYPLFRRRG